MEEEEEGGRSSEEPSIGIDRDTTGNVAACELPLIENNVHHSRQMKVSHYARSWRRDRLIYWVPRAWFAVYTNIHICIYIYIYSFSLLLHASCQSFGGPSVLSKGVCCVCVCIVCSGL